VHEDSDQFLSLPALMIMRVTIGSIFVCAGADLERVAVHDQLASGAHGDLFMINCNAPIAKLE